MKPSSLLSCALFLSLMPALVCAKDEPPSLFFSPEEVQRIELEMEPHLPELTTNMARLDSILYFSPKKWTVWLQGEKWTPETRKPHMRIVKVSSEDVRLAFIPTGEKEEKEITLRPAQSFDPMTGLVSESRSILVKSK